VALGLAVLALAFAVAVPAAIFGTFALSAAKPGSDAKLVIEIRKGESPGEIARALAALGATSDGRKLFWLGRITRQWKWVKAGEYEVSPAMSAIELLAVVTSGVSVAHPVTVREGENMYEIAEDIETKRLAPSAKLLALFRDARFIATLGFGASAPATLEGYLFPDTYNFDRTLTPEEITRRMVKRFFSQWGTTEETRARELAMSRDQLITLASMIEKETGAPAERPVISSVFHNRLRLGMKLQSDPTTIYGMWDRYEGKIHKSDLLEENPYNTYTVPALPAGPIANPGSESIHAALYPAKSEFLYFVSHNDGTHEFTRSLDEHNAAVRKFQLDPKMREGKSWRDLEKKPAT
jgi:UPF0755 protein